MPTLHLFPGITQMTLISGPRQLHKLFPGNLKVTFLSVIKWNWARPAWFYISIKAQSSDPNGVGRRGAALETCMQNHSTGWSVCREAARNQRRKGGLRAQPPLFIMGLWDPLTHWSAASWGFWFKDAWGKNSGLVFEQIDDSPFCHEKDPRKL